MKIMVLGAAGMAGHVVETYLTECGHDIYTVARNRTSSSKNRPIDVTDFRALEAWLDEVQPAVIVNCIGLLQKSCEQRPDLAVLVNSYLPHCIANKYTHSETRLIHLSTDCVFSGKRGGYKETDITDGDTMYDRSKALGEVINNKDLTFRMSIIGPDCNKNGTGLFHWFMNQTGKISGFRKAIWSGVTTIELARAIDSAISQNLTGLYQLSPKDPIDKYALLMLFKEVFKREVEIYPNDEIILDKSLINTRTDFDFSIKGYREQIEDMYMWVKTHGNMYEYGV